MPMIYADNASTTRISDKAFEAMLPYLREQYGNASSQYSLGAKAKRAVEHARKQISEAIGSETDEITFTSSGTKANCWVLRGIAEVEWGETIHIVTSSIEHPSILNMCHTLETMGVEVTYLPVDRYGLVSLDNLKAAIKSNTKLVSIMLSNNEIGTIQPIADIGKFLRARNILFHTDAVQAVGRVPVDVNDLCVDFLTASAHKFYGAKGIGILFKRSGVALPPLLFGGRQEHGLRAGTENVAGIVSAGYAIEECMAVMGENVKRLTAIINDTINGIISRIPNVIINGEFTSRLPGMISLGFDSISGESLMHLLDLKGICVSTSSACNAGKDEPSHVLLALGQTDEQAKSAIRISYGRYNNDKDGKLVAEAICEAFDKIMGRGIG